MGRFKIEFEGREWGATALPPGCLYFGIKGEPRDRLFEIGPGAFADDDFAVGWQELRCGFEAHPVGVAEAALGDALEVDRTSHRAL